MSEEENTYLAHIADAYNPFLLVISLFVAAQLWSKGDRLFSLALILSISLAYFLMFIDKWLNVFGSIGLDYSTHTATSTVMASILVLVLERLFKFVVITSLIAYFILMVYMKYHTPLDIIVTFILVTLICLPTQLGLISKRSLTTIRVQK